SFLEKNKSKLHELENDAHYQQWADLLMAHLHELKPGMESVTVRNFYNNDQLVEIKLKADLTPQKNAEVYYRKGKNQSIELATLRNAIERKESEVQQLLAWQKTVNDAQDIRELKNISPSILKDPQAKEQVKSLPYKAYEYKGYVIWVGKNASANDELTLKYSYKDDLWLHAKDVAGSHVLIKHQAGKNFPKDVIERGAALAAYYSKRKNESLCPVAYTSKKYVRKRKGDPAGAVVVEREEVILVTPQE
ncbi:MAG: NFACT RNA binding domain-containing protein, partial [Cyclobacteriaceae bacterium]|nr:NFACT RNA binding domain-containing protein [Cyclobacteriaceae bacterium]